MNQILTFFIQTQSTQFISTQNSKINIKLLSSNFSLDSQLFITQNNTYFLINNSPYQIFVEIQMKPLYIGPQLSKIMLINRENISIELSSRNPLDIAKLYEALSRKYSHKGFMEYFNICKRLGKGSFATVYLVENKCTKAKKAAKVFSKEGHKLQYKGKQSLEHQIQILKTLKHPNVIKLDGIYETEGLIYLVTQYLSGGTLDQTMKNKFSHSAENTIKIFRDILSGLQYLSSRNIMHRDIKPDNIMLREDDGCWVITDFGLATLANQDYLSYGTCGTMGYIAPQIMQKSEKAKSYGPTCDMYSFGVIAYTIIVGTLPFKVETENMFDKKIVWQFFTKPQCKLIPEPIVKFLRKLLQKDPKDRIKSQEALKQSIFTDSSILDQLVVYQDANKKQRYDRILKIANC